MKVKSLLLKAGENPEVVYVEEQEICSKIGCEKCMVNGYLGNGGAININYESDAKEKGKPYNCTFSGVTYYGNILFVGMSACDTSLTEEQVAFIQANISR